MMDKQEKNGLSLNNKTNGEQLFQTQTAIIIILK